jgi:hypothetical protein
MSNTLVVTNIRLPKEDLIDYRQLALSMGKSFSQLVREALARLIQPVEVKITKTRKYPAFEEIDKIAVNAGPRDAAQEHDKYIY